MTIPQAQSIMSKYEVGVMNAKKRVIIRRMMFNNVKAGPTTNAKRPKITAFAKILTTKVRVLIMKAPVFVIQVTKFVKTLVMIVTKSENVLNSDDPRFGNPKPLPTQFKKFTI